MNLSSLFRSRLPMVGLLVLCAELSSACIATAQQRILPPTLLAIYPAGTSAGSEVEVEITSQQQLEGADRLVFSHRGITAKRVMRAADRFYPEARPVEHKFTVSVADDVPAGIYEVRAGGKYGLSNPRRFVVGNAPEVLEVEDNNTPEKAQLVTTPVVLNGLSEASQVDFFAFEAKAGESLVIDAYSERLDARGDLALALFTEQGALLARGIHSTVGDPAIPFTPSSAGKYLLRVYEVSYNNFPNAVASPYRVTINSSPWIDSIYPPIAQRGKTSAFTLYGRNLGPEAVPAKRAGQELEKLSVDIAVPALHAISSDLTFDPLSAGLDWFVYRHEVRGELSNPVRIALAGLALTAEQEPNEASDAAQQVSLPCEILGHFNRPNDLDWFSFTAKAGEEVWIEIDGQRLNEPVDPLLVVQRVVLRENAEPQLKELATQDDLDSPFPQMMSRLSSQDASWLLKVSEEGTYRVMVRDQFGAADAGSMPYYRLRMGTPQPDFRLLAFPGLEDTANGLQQQPGPRSCAIPSGGAEEILIVALRRDGFEGAIEILPTEQPSGISAPAIVLGENENRGVFIVRAAAGAKFDNASLKLEGRATIGEKLRTVPVFATVQTWNTDNQYGFPARLTERIALSIDEMLPAIGRLEPTEQKVWRMARGGKLAIPLKFTKLRDDFKGTISMGAIDLPENNRIRAPMVNLSPGSTGKLELDVQPDATAGMFTLVARGEAEIDYRRNLDLAEQAAADRKRIDEVAKEIQAAFQQSQKDRQAAEGQLNASQQKRNRSEQLRNQAQQRLDQATAADKQAAQRVATAQEQVAAMEKRVTEVKALVAAAGDENAKQQAEAQLRQAMQQLEQAQTQFEQLQTQQTETARQLVEATGDLGKAVAELKTSEAQLLAATETRAKSMEAEQAAQADVQLSQRMQQEATSVLNRNNGVARQQKLRLSAHSDPIRVEIVPYPIRVKLNAMPLTLKAGETIQFAPSVVREFDFDGEVTFQLQGVNGLRFEQADRISKGKDRAALPILVDRNAPVGEHELTFIIRMNFNGRGLEQRERVKLTIQPAPPEEKK
jgi:hypothetical protein